MSKDLAKHLMKLEGAVVLLVTAGYVWLTFYSLWRWNEAISGGLVTGFALFAQRAVDKFFELVKSEAEEPDPPIATMTVTKP